MQSRKGELEVVWNTKATTWCNIFSTERLDQL